MPIMIKKLGQKGGPKGQDKVVPPNKKKPTPKPFKKKSELMGKKPMKAGGMMKKKGMSKGGKLRMVEKDGKKVPFFAADGKGKMAAGGMMKKKGYAKGGAVKVKSGDTLSQIAKSKGVTLKALMAANPGIKNANEIRVGQSIKMPAAGTGRGGVYSGMTKSSMKAMADDTTAKRAKKVVASSGGKKRIRRRKGADLPEQANKRARVTTRLNQLGEINRQRRAADAKKGGGSMKKKGYAKGGMIKKKGMAKGGVMRGGGAAAKGRKFTRSG